MTDKKPAPRRTVREAYKLPASLVIARLETPNFVFEGAGTTEEQARAALLKAVRKHIAVTGASASFFAELMTDLPCRTYFAGSAYRDGDCLVGAP